MEWGGEKWSPRIKTRLKEEHHLIEWEQVARKYTTARRYKSKTLYPRQARDSRILENSMDPHKGVSTPSLTIAEARSGRWRCRWGCWWWHWKRELFHGKDNRPVYEREGERVRIEWRGDKRTNFIRFQRKKTRLMREHRNIDWEQIARIHTTARTYKSKTLSNQTMREF